MSESISPFEVNPPSRQRLIASVAVALAGAALVLLIIVLPAEYNIDPTRIGGALGLTAMHAPKRTLQVKDVIGGNEKYREVALPSLDKPVPLPNRAVIQVKPAAARTENVSVTLQPGQQTEIKAVMDAAQVILYSWTAEGGEVYTDFHGHEPEAGDAFVRYEEQQSGHEGHGSLVAPFSGEHGWFWLNISEQPVTIRLMFSGYHHEVKNYGLIE
jgi:hypothetical protein